MIILPINNSIGTKMITIINCFNNHHYNYNLF